MTQHELAAQLGLSDAMVSKLAKRGMPTHSVEAARAWRQANMDPAWRPVTRGDRQRAAEAALSRVRSWAAVATAAVLEGNEPAFLAVREQLRAALRAVPAAARDQVGMDMRLWDRLTAGFLDIPPAEFVDEVREGAFPGDTPIVHPDIAGGDFWYALAAGEHHPWMDPD